MSRTEGEAANYDGDLEIVRNYDWTTTSPCAAIVDAITDIEGTDETNLDLVLYEYVESDALDDLVRNTRHNDVAIQLTIDAYQVEVTRDTLRVKRVD